MTWTDATTPFDPGGSANGGCWADDLEEFVGVGFDGAFAEAIIKSSDAINWIYRASPFDGDAANGVARSLFHGLYVVAGQSSDALTAIITSPDLVTWTGRGNPFAGNAGGCVGCNDDSGVVLVGGLAGVSPLQRSTDGLAYVGVASPFSFGGAVTGIAYSPTETRWMASGIDSSFNAAVAYSDDDGLTWTLIATHPMQSLVLEPRVYRDEANGNWYLLGQTTGGKTLAVSGDGGSTWTEVATPLDPVGPGDPGVAYAMVNAGGTFALGGADGTGTKQMCSSSDGLAWIFDVDPSPFAAGTAFALAYSPTIPAAVAFGAG